MRIKFFLLVTALSAVCLLAQQESPPAAEGQYRPRAYVRRFSAGATLSILGLKLVPGDDMNVVTANPAVDALYSTAGKSKRAGYGLTAQLAITERFAVNASLLRRQAGYRAIQDIHTGVDNPNTVPDERAYSRREEETSAKFFDLPVLIRFYNRERHEPGPRFFAQFGAALRRVSGVSSSTTTTVGTKPPECCDTTPAMPARRTLRGLVAGFGVQVIDPVGIRIVPEVRYTRWAGQSFSHLTTFTERNQIEAMISVTF